MAIWWGTRMVGHHNDGLTWCGNGSISTSEDMRAEKERGSKVIFELEKGNVDHAILVEIIRKSRDVFLQTDMRGSKCTGKTRPLILMIRGTCIWNWRRRPLEGFYPGHLVGLKSASSRTQNNELTISYFVTRFEQAVGGKGWNSWGWGCRRRHGGLSWSEPRAGPNSWTIALQSENRS